MCEISYKQWSRYADPDVIEQGYRIDHIPYIKQGNYDETELYKANFVIIFPSKTAAVSVLPSGSEYANSRYFDYLYGIDINALTFKGTILWARIIISIGY